MDINDLRYSGNDDDVVDQDMRYDERQVIPLVFLKTRTFEKKNRSKSNIKTK